MLLLYSVAALFVGTLADWFQEMCQHLLSASAIFALIDPAHDIFHIASFSVMCCYLNFLADFCYSLSSSKLNWLIFLKCTGSGLYSICACAKSDEKYVLQWLYACTLCANRYLHLQKENVIPLFLHSMMSDTFFIRIYTDARVF